MALEDYKNMVARCARCSYCKWIPFANVQNWRFAKGCPSVEYNKFQSFAAGGRLAATLSFLEGRSSCTEGFQKIVYSCLMDGMCDVACKVGRYNMEPLEVMRELRYRMVELGQYMPEHAILVDSLRQNDNTMCEPKANRGQWAEGLDVKNVTAEQCDVVFHAGCRYSYDKDLWNVPRTAVSLLKKAGVNIGIMGKDETCCGGRVNDMGFAGELTKYAESTIQAWKSAGVKEVVTSCADCFHSFIRLYPALGSKIKVYHTVEYIEKLIKEGKIKFSKEIPMTVTYHDPCHLGRRGESYIPWNGKEIKMRGQIICYDPPKPRYSGSRGVYEAPRNVLKSIPGVELIEMTRIREYAWCCGAGGGVPEAYPDFSSWVAGERIAEANSTGANMLVTACSRCERNFKDAVEKNHEKIKVMDIVELVQQAI